MTTQTASMHDTVSPAQAVVAVQGLTKTFKDFWLRTRARAVDQLTFHVAKGEVFGLLGPNGSGKSTTIKVMLGLLKPTAGRVSVFGKPPTDVAIKSRVGYLPEESYLYPFLNARETLEYYAKLFQIDRSVREKRIDELLEMVGLASVQYRQVREYSKGMQRRIGIAQALINDPELLILDEPTTGLDPIGTRQIKDLIIELGRRGKSIVLSSHLLSDVEDCVSRMIILYGGKKQAEGTCDSLLAVADRSIIETDALDERTLGRIDEVIRAGTGGTSGIGRVSRPRQRLEDLFVDIVNRATASRMETSGAKHGGATAEFLRARTEGAGLLEQLTQPAAPAATPEPAPVQQVALKPTGPDADLLGQLAGGAPTKGQPAQSQTPAKATKADSATAKPQVDTSLLDELTGGGGKA
jgi:ABC-2 type transport system ATP-binding protein